MSEVQTKAVALQDLPDLRRRTEGIAKLLHEQLKHHLETLRPLFSPERVFGKHAGGRIDISGAELAVSELQQKYRPFSAKPYDLPVEFDPHWLTIVGNRLELHPWDYVHEAKTDRETKLVTMTSPLQWIVAYASNYSVVQAKQVIAGKEQRRPEYLRQFVVNALVLQIVVSRLPGLVQLFSDLRYELKVSTSPDLKTLPLVTIGSCLPSFRPADDLILAATAFSGVPAFIELTDVDAVRSLQDPLKLRIEDMLK